MLRFLSLYFLYSSPTLSYSLTHSFTCLLDHTVTHTHSHTHCCSAQIKHSRGVWMRGEEKWRRVITVKYYQSLLCAVTWRWETRLRVARFHDCLQSANARLILFLLPPLILLLFSSAAIGAPVNESALVNLFFTSWKVDSWVNPLHLQVDLDRNEDCFTNRGYAAATDKALEVGCIA